MNFCPGCGEEIPEGAEYCPKCGTNLVEVSERQATPGVEYPLNIETVLSRKNIVLATFAGIFIAWIGVVAAVFGNSQIVIGFGSFLNTLGFAIVGGCLIGGGISNPDLDKYVRLGMILGGAFVIASTLGVGIAQGLF